MIPFKPAATELAQKLQASLAQAQCKFGSVATVRRRTSGHFQAQPPQGVQIDAETFDTQQEAVQWAVAHGWGVQMR